MRTRALTITAVAYVIGGLSVLLRKIVLELRRRERARRPQTTTEILPAVTPREAKPEATAQTTADVSYRSNAPMRGHAEWMNH